jgi:hypothetical protein
VVEVSCQRIELTRPEALVLSHPGHGMLHRITHQPADVQAPLAAASQQARALQNSQVPGDRGQRDVVWRGQLAHGRLTARKPVYDGAPRGIGQRAKRRIERGGGMRRAPAPPPIGTGGHRRATWPV